jgi:O-acetyl-ADP-ribose deacetylase (regulator of RNase III)
MYNEIEGDLIQLAKSGSFDAITHGCNCFCTMKAGIAPQMAKTFKCNNTFSFGLEGSEFKGDINKLGQIEYNTAVPLVKGPNGYLIVINSYTQYEYGTDKVNVDYDALTLCMRKINHEFKGKKIGLPKIGAGLAGGDWIKIKNIIETELKDCDVTVVILP